MTSPEQRRARQATLSVDLGPKLLMEVETMRRTLQDEAPHLRAVSRGDVVRLALWRLKLALLAHECETRDDTELPRLEWFDVARAIHLDAICPDWLVPGRTEQIPPERAKPTKKSATKPKKGGSKT